MSYPTDPLKILRLTDEESEALLASVWSAPVPRPIVRIPLASKDTTLKRKTAPAGRKGYALARIAKGDKRCDIAFSLGISASMLSRILTGARN
jgi:hypothetical protein